MQQLGAATCGVGRKPALRAAFILAVVLCATLFVGPAQGHHGTAFSCGDGCAKVGVLFDPRFSPAPPTAGRASQPGEEWDGTAAIPDPLGAAGAADTREFQVSPTYDTAAVTATVTWDQGLAVVYDLDLFIDKRTDSGAWVTLASSTNSQSLGEGEPTESAQVASPEPGTYRTRVVNWASTQVAYHGVLAFAAGKPGGGGKPTRAGRVTEDRPDLTQDPAVHVMYVLPADGADGQLDTNGVLEDSAGAMNLWLGQQTNGRSLRLDTYLDRRTSRLDISFVRLAQTAAQVSESGDAITAVTNELEHLGWTADPSRKRYLVYYEGAAESPGICGTAYYPLAGGFAQWSVVWLGSSSGCQARDFGNPTIGGGMNEAIAWHELFHNEAIVPAAAPHHCWAFTFHLCTAAAGAALDTLDPEAADLMFPFVTFPLRDKVVDRDRDDYYDHPFPWRDMADSPFLEGTAG